MWCVAAVLGASVMAGSMPTSLPPQTVQAWDRYIQWATQRIERRLPDVSALLIHDQVNAAGRASLQSRLASGEVVVEKVNHVVPSGARFEVAGGEIHHWWGGILIPNTALPELLRFLQDYDHHAGKFADVEKSKLLSRSGDHFTFYFRLRRSKAFVTAYYNTEQECTYRNWGPKLVTSHSVATRIAELENPGTASEHEKPPGDDRGFLWRLVSWWRFQQTPNGVLIELESASLSRDIPTFVKFIPGVSSYIRSTPKESMESVLLSIRRHVNGPGDR